MENACVMLQVPKRTVTTSGSQRVITGRVPRETGSCFVLCQLFLKKRKRNHSSAIHRTEMENQQFLSLFPEKIPVKRLFFRFGSRLFRNCGSFRSSGLGRSSLLRCGSLRSSGLSRSSLLQCGLLRCSGFGRSSLLRCGSLRSSSGLSCNGLRRGSFLRSGCGFRTCYLRLGHGSDLLKINDRHL